MVYNYLSFEVSNFLVQDRGSLQTIVDESIGRRDITQPPASGDGQLTF